MGILWSQKDSIGLSHTKVQLYLIMFISSNITSSNMTEFCTEVYLEILCFETITMPVKCENWVLMSGVQNN